MFLFQALTQQERLGESPVSGSWCARYSIRACCLAFVLSEKMATAVSDLARRVAHG